MENHHIIFLKMLLLWKVGNSQKIKIKFVRKKKSKKLQDLDDDRRGPEALDTFFFYY